MNQRSIDRASDLLRRNAEDDRRPVDITLLGREWTLLPGVFSPTYTPVTELFTQWLRYPVGGRFLEMGCGIGITAVTAALSGCREVTAVDIATAAVENTRRNAERHGVADRVRTLQGDMFDSLDPDERFDSIFWNSNFVEVPADFANTSELHHAFFDPGYGAHRRFVRQAPRRLNAGGHLLLGFSDLGNRRLLDELCNQAGLTITTLISERRSLEVTVEFQLLELMRGGHQARITWS